MLESFTPVIESVKLIPSSGGRFEVMANDKLIYSKKAEGRHAEEGEVVRRFSEAFGIEAMPK
ncbi:MAG: SelT/SelW/SelH family protein [Caldilineaceae bacterium]|nr:SelT/SelW/SelH family protein [Caldilineaceae bacterium]HRJ44281.1 Rdx family protein [Caldilineaceae bacterium]